ncbi:hypothetical protein SKAU_G00372690 [Synaphobranchus kaupii]|uniref:Uncharacterized protein n=1 Tax=Synaphobranchus kaupii TaxID=118154 RepID=A0A9Q1EGD4_SYNKA|nr:hypothetical protein SKAU_G00372690 [Synaphobranchus kaupii]
MEVLRAHATDFRIPNRIDLNDHFHRRRQKRHRRPRNRIHGQSAAGTAGSVENSRVGENGHPPSDWSESGSLSYSQYSDESGSDSEMSDTERAGRGWPRKNSGGEVAPKSLPDSICSQPLDYFGEHLAFIDESSDALSERLKTGFLLDRTLPNSVPPQKPKRRRSRKLLQTSSRTPLCKDRNGDIHPPSEPPPPPPEPLKEAEIASILGKCSPKPARHQQALIPDSRGAVRPFFLLTLTQTNIECGVAWEWNRPSQFCCPKRHFCSALEQGVSLRNAFPFNWP